MGGARRRAGRDGLSLPHGYHERDAVAGPVRKEQRGTDTKVTAPSQVKQSVDVGGGLPPLVPQGRCAKRAARVGGPAVLAAQMPVSKHHRRERKSLGLATETTATIEKEQRAAVAHAKSGVLTREGL